MQSLPKLTELDLVGIGTGTYANCTSWLPSPNNLTTLSLSRCRLTDADIAGICRSTKHLVALDLAGNRISSECLVHIRTLETLRRLDISATTIFDLETLCVFQGGCAGKLHTFCASKNGLQDRAIHMITTSMVNLTSLTIDRANFSFQGFSGLFRLKKLRFLDMSYNVAAIEWNAALAGMETFGVLERFKIYGCGGSLDIFRKLMPHVVQWF